MSHIDEHTFEVLEWPAIQEMLAAEADSNVGSDLARSVGPLPTLDEAQGVRDEIAEFRVLLSKETALPFDGVFDIRESVQRSRPEGAILAATDLARIAATLDATSAIRLIITCSKALCPRLHAIAARLDAHPELVSEIHAAIEKTGEVKDSASRELSHLRNQLHELRSLIQNRLQSLLSEPTLQPFVAEPIITLRNERYVIPVKPNCRSVLKGVVQDRSVSGATLFLEPQQVVELNNQLRLLQRAEEEEVRKVLARLTAAIRPRAEAILKTVLLAAELDLRSAAARLANNLHAAPPSLKKAGPLILLQARHPLLLKQALAAGEREAIPIDLLVGEAFEALLITGPNTGGKTVALKTAGLLSLMALAGLHLPASADSEVPFFSGVLADIGDEQSIVQNLSTFSSHIGHIQQILEAVSPGALVLLDELGAGTDPVEGACLGIAILEALLERRALVMATSHLDAIKAYAYAHPRIENGCVEFDLDTLRPLYKLSIGLSGRSHALAIASRIGLPQSLIQRAKVLLGDGADPLRPLLERLEVERQRLVEERAGLAREMAEAAKTRGEAEAQRDTVRAEADKLSRRARQQVETAVSNARSEVARILREFRSAEEREQAAREVRKRLTELDLQAETALRKVADRDHQDHGPSTVRPGLPQGSGVRSICPGLRVRIRGLEQRGTVSGDPTPAGLVEVQLSLGRVRLPVEALIPEEDMPQGEAGPSVQVTRAGEETPAELNLIGCDAAEAARRLDRYVGDAFLAGLPTVRVIHGKGGGILRRTVAELLQGHPLVLSFRLADYREGGVGTTVIELHSYGVPLGGAA